MVERAVIPVIVAQHVEELAILWNTRRTLASAGHVPLRHLARFDERIAAHQDGCVVAGEYGMRQLKEQLADAGPAQMFAATVVALDMSDRAAFEHCLAIMEAVPVSFAGAASAVGWITSQRLKGVAKDLLAAHAPIRRRLGLAACRLHGADPGAALAAGLQDADPGVCAEALRTAGTLGRRDLIESVARARASGDPAVGLRAVWAGVLLGERQHQVEALARVAIDVHPHRTAAMELALRVMEMSRAHALLERFAQTP